MITVHEMDKPINVSLSLSKQRIVETLAPRIAEAYQQGASDGVDSAVRDCINTLIVCEYHSAARVLERTMLAQGAPGVDGQGGMKCTK